jgi:hypothetical protein
MKRIVGMLVVAAALSRMCGAARCTTVMDAEAMRAYESYVAAAEQRMPARIAAGELQWVPQAARRELQAKLRAGKLVRRDLSDAELNRTLAAHNGTILHWIGAIRIARAQIADLRSMLNDYADYPRIYHPMVSASRATPTASGATYDVALELYQAFRFASVFPQHYAFRVKGQMQRGSTPDGLDLRLHSEEIRESDSGAPGADDLLQPYRDHGIMWALNAWWRGRSSGPDVYLEFETITLARAVQTFACKIGFVPVPKSIVASAMDSLPAESVTTILEGTRAEFARRARLAGAGNRP